MAALDDAETETCPHCGNPVDPQLCRNIIREPSGRDRVQYSCYKCGEHLPGAGHDGGRFA
jgi:RNase P subunit RPR2